MTADDLGGFDAVAPPRRDLERPARRPQPGDDVRDQPPARRRSSPRDAKAAGVERFVFSSSCSLYGAAGRRRSSTRRPRSTRSRRTARSKVLAEHDLRELADDALQPDVPAQRDRVRRLAAAARRPRRQQPAGYAVTTGRVLIKSDGTPWRPLVHIEDISRAFLAALEAPRELVHDEAFNVGRTEENFRIREVAAIVEEVVPGQPRRVRARAAGPTCGTTASTATKLARDAARRSGRGGRCGAGSRSCMRRSTRQRLTLEEFTSGALPAHPAREGAAGRGRARRRPAPAGPRACRRADGATLPLLRRHGGSRSSCRSATCRSRTRCCGPTSSTSPSRATRSTSPFCPDCSLVQILAEVPPERALRRQLPLLLVVLGRAAARTRASTRSSSSRRAGSGPAASWSRSPRTTAICCATSSRPACRCSASTRRRAGRRGRGGGVPTLREFFGSELARRLRAEGRRADVIVANNVLAHTPDPDEPRRGHGDPARRRRHRDDREHYVARPGRQPRVRHDLPRALLVLLVHGRRRARCGGTGSRCNDVEHFPALQGGTLRWSARPRAAPDGSVARASSTRSGERPDAAGVLPPLRRARRRAPDRPARAARAR